MSATAIVLIVVGVLVLALVYFATRGSEKSKPRREEKRHRKAELGRAVERERHDADAYKAWAARTARADEEREAHEYNWRTAELERAAGNHGNGRK